MVSVFFFFFVCVVCPQKVYSSSERESSTHSDPRWYHTIPSIRFDRSIDAPQGSKKTPFFVGLWSKSSFGRRDHKRRIIIERERERERERKKNQSRFCAKETHESSSSSSSVRLDDARWRRRRGEVSESSDENNEATRTARLFFEMARDDDDDDEWRYVSNASTRRT